MSADGSTVCPNCHPDLVDWVSPKKRWDGSDNHVTDHAAEELGYDRSMREYYEFYMEDGKRIVADYSATCRDCQFTVSFKYEHPFTVEGKSG